MRKGRQKNPAPAFVVPVLSFFAGAVTTAGVVYGSLSSPKALPTGSEVVHFEDKPILLFFRPDTLAAATIAKASGPPGKYSHVAVYPALRTPDGDPILLDADPKQGAVFRPLSAYEGRKVDVVVLPPETREYIQGAAWGALGRPYKFRRGGDHCAEVTYRLLPPSIRNRLNFHGGRITPNTLYQAFIELAKTDERLLVKELDELVEI